MQVNREKLKERIRECRKKAGLTQEELAYRLHVKRQIISYYESVESERTPNIDILATMAGLFNTTTDYLLGRTDVQSIDTEIKAVCDYTGLSESAIQTTHHFKHCYDSYEETMENYSLVKSYFDFINYLMIAKIDRITLLSSISEYEKTMKEQTKKIETAIKKYQEILKSGHFDDYRALEDRLHSERFDAEDKIGYAKYSLVKVYEKFINEYLYDECEEYKTISEEYEKISSIIADECVKVRCTNAHNNETE